mmetsp:Transcript_5796/g.10407  ORF Transcript_5796/g.10407 Transcript_5796/m.10407 type:complete len:159 (+) Transcript_5796:50-526(+)
MVVNRHQEIIRHQCWANVIQNERQAQYNWADKGSKAFTLAARRSPSTPSRPSRAPHQGTGDSQVIDSHMVPVPARTEYFPIGGRNRMNNHSSAFHISFGTGTWVGSGGIQSLHRASFGGKDFQTPQEKALKYPAFKHTATMQLKSSGSLSLPTLSLTR